jgi:hypothetical protein
MTLSDKQFEFARTMAEFELWIAARWKYTRGEGYRSPQEAERLAKLGKGIKNSNHCKKLAQDLFIFDEHGNPWNDDVYRQAAEKWVTMHELARAGHYFKGRDSVHFSFIHNGVQ